MSSESSGPSAVLMVRPHAFRVNPETAADNAFQASGGGEHSNAYREVSAVADRLRAHGITVHLFEDDGAATPDSVFPNNWLTTHEDGRIALHPMRAANRRAERRDDIVDHLRSAYVAGELVDYSSFEERGLFLEGTGSLVLDRQNRWAFAALSPRTSQELVERFCADFGYEPVVFEASDSSGTPVYHTNVMLALGTGFAIAGLEMIPNEKQRRKVEERLRASGREIIEVSEAQVRDFAANVYALSGPGGTLLALSCRAAGALTAAQKKAIENHATLLPVPVPTIERAGGSVRCMLAGIHLPPKD